MKAKADGYGRKLTAIAFAFLFALSGPASAIDLQPQTNLAYDRYIQITETQVDNELKDTNRFLWVETLADPRRAGELAALQRGEVIIERLQTLDNDAAIQVPGGLIHHWMGTVFIPGATLDQTLAFLQDYDHKVEYFKPDILQSTTLKHSGGDYFVHLRFFTKKVITTVVDTDQKIHYERVDATHAWSRSATTRVQEVSNPGERDETLEPEGHDRGFVWRMNTFWRFEQKDGGTYVECQAISLSRDIPTGIGWMVGPFVTSVPKESLTFTLTTARTALEKKISSAK
jgi:hypothetical protein